MPENFGEGHIDEPNSDVSFLGNNAETTLVEEILGPEGYYVGNDYDGRDTGECEITIVGNITDEEIDPEDSYENLTVGQFREQFSPDLNEESVSYRNRLIELLYTPITLKLIIGKIKAVISTLIRSNAKNSLPEEESQIELSHIGHELDLMDEFRRVALESTDDLVRQ